MERNKRKKYFSSNLMMKKRRNLFLQVGYKGFISTCNGNEKQCVRESYNILNEYADKIYGEEDWKKKVDPTEPTEESNDVMDDLDKEIEGYKAKKSGEVERRFLAVDTGVLNCVFIKTNLEDPTSLLDAIVRDLFCSKLKKTRFLLRMIPIEVTCKAYEEDIKKAAGPLFDKYFKSEPTSFSIVFNRRHNSNVDRDTVIKDLAQLVSDRNSKHVVNLTHPTHAIIVEVMKNICGLSVIRNYFDFSKYNFSNICGIDTSFDRHPTSVNESKVESQDEPKSCTDEGSKKEEKASSDEQVNDTYAKGETLNESNDEPVDPTRPNVEVSESDNDSKVATKET